MSKHTHNTSESSPGSGALSALPKPQLKGYLFGQLCGKGTYGYVFRATKIVSLSKKLQLLRNIKISFSVELAKRCCCSQVHSSKNTVKNNKRKCNSRDFYIEAIET